MLDTPYVAYGEKTRYFELLDMLNKLFLSSLVLFFPAEIRLPAGMVWAVLFHMLLLLIRPYVRATDGMNE